MNLSLKPSDLCSNVISLERPSQAPNLKNYPQSVGLNLFALFYFLHRTPCYPILYSILIYLYSVCLLALQGKLLEDRDLVSFVLPRSQMVPSLVKYLVNIVE